jgi:2'-5' RNA ligase
MDIKNNTIRTFIACPIPAAILKKISHVQDQIMSYQWKVRWVPVSNIHLTLSFLGDIHPSMQQQIVHAINPLIDTQKSFALNLGNLGVFPNARRPNVLWIGLTGEIRPLVIFQKNLQAALIPLGFPDNKRNFKAHLTLGRIKGPVPKNQLAEVLCMDISGENLQFCCDLLVFYQSKLSSKGAQYFRLHDWKLRT